MAETDSRDSNNSIHSVASAGGNLSASLLSFATKWDSGQNYIIAIAVVASTIKNLLLDAKSTIEKHGDDWPEENGIHIVCQGIKADFEKIARALEKANLKAGPGNFVERPSKKVAAVRYSRRLEVVEDTDWKEGMVDQSFLNKHPSGVTLLRAELESDPFILGRLEEAKDHLWYLCEGFRYLTLRKLQKEEQLQPDDSRELEKLAEQLPTVVAELGYRKNFILDSAMKLKAVELRKREILQNGNGPVDDSPRMNGINDGPRARRSVYNDDDAGSILSVDSLASFTFLDVDEVYEAWVIRKYEGEKNWFRRSWSLGWFRVYEYCNNSGYEIESQAMDIEQMKEQSEAVKSGELKPEQIALIENKMATLPPGVQVEIKNIVEDRARISTNPRYTRKWKIVDVIAKAPQLEPTSFWMMLFKGQQAFSEALFIIKGETANPNDVLKPLRDEDPFKKPQYRRYRGHRFNPREGRVELRPERHVPGGNRARRGSTGHIIADRVINDPKALNPEDAESKIEEILAEIAAVYNEEQEIFVSDQLTVGLT